jgi:hypothetical protein
MDNFNRILSFIIGLVVVIVVIAIVANRLNVRKRISNLTASITKSSPSATPTFSPSDTPSITRKPTQIAYGSNNTKGGLEVPSNNTNSNGSGTYSSTTKGGQASSVPATGAPTLLLPLAFSGILLGGKLRKKK